MQKNVNNGFLRAAGLHLEGNCPYGANETLGLAEGCVSFSVTDATTSALGEEFIAEMDKAQADIVSGAIAVDTAF